MKKRILFSCFLITSLMLSFSQPNPSSEKTGGPVKVYCNNGYIVKAKNSSNKPYRFSFRYETLGYTISKQAWAKYPVYTLVSTTTDEYKNSTLEGNEERNLFTAPEDINKKIVYFIKILEVYLWEELTK